MLTISPTPIGEYPIVRLRTVAAECDAIAADLRAIGASVQWESEAARAFFLRVGEAVGQVVAAGAVASEVAAIVQWQLDAALDEGSEE